MAPNRYGLPVWLAAKAMIFPAAPAGSGPSGSSWHRALAGAVMAWAPPAAYRAAWARTSSTYQPAWL